MTNSLTKDQLTCLFSLGASTVKEVIATTTRSPMRSLVALASGLGRVAIMDFVDWLSGVSVVR